VAAAAAAQDTIAAGAALHLCGTGASRSAPPRGRAGLELDPSNAGMRQGLEQARAAAAGPPPAPAGGGMFGPEFMGRLALNPETRGYMAQPDFMAMLQALGRDPSQMTACAPARGLVKGCCCWPDFMAMLQVLGRDPSRMTACGPARRPRTAHCPPRQHARVRSAVGCQGQAR